MTQLKIEGLPKPHVIAQPPERKKRTKYKWFIGGAVAAFAMILVTILIIVYFVVHKQKMIEIHQNVRNNDETDKVYPEENIVWQRTQVGDSFISSVMDFDRRIVTILTEVDGHDCWLMPMFFNTTSAEEDANLLQKPIKEEKALCMKKVLHPVPNRRFLSQQAKELCDGRDIYWQYPEQCPKKKNGERQKRENSCDPELNSCSVVLHDGVNHWHFK